MLEKMGKWENYLEGGGLQSEELIKSTQFCKVHYVLNSDIKYAITMKFCKFCRHKPFYSVSVSGTFLKDIVTRNPIGVGSI